MTNSSEPPLAAWDGHLLLLHRSAGVRGTGLHEWTRRGLENHDRVIYPCTRDDADLADAILLLSGSGAEPDPAITDAAADGRLLVLSPESFYPAGHLQALVRDAFADGFAGVRMAGHATTALELLGRRGYAAFELELEQLCRGGQVSALCTYDESDVPADQVHQGAAVHASGFHHDTVIALVRPTGIWLVGELDRSTAGMLTAALTAVTAERPSEQELTLHAGALSFCDVAGARAVLVGTEAFRQRGGRVRVRALTPPVRRVLDLFQVEREPGMVVDADEL